MSGAQGLRAAALHRLPALRLAYPAQFRRATPGRLRAGGIVLGAMLLLGFGIWRLQVAPSRLLAGLGQLVQFLGLMLPPDPGSAAQALSILHALAETLAIAFLGTLLAASLALPVGLPAARNTTINGLVRFAARRVLDGIRGVDALIWALIWVGVVGLGPLAGVLAIMTSDIGTFGKMYSEALEAADRRAEEGVVAAGGAGLARLRFGVLPGVLPVMAGQVLYMFESNTRSSTIIGIVGAGGIGLTLTEMIRTLEWPAVAFILLLVLAMVAAIDALAARLRRRLTGA